MCGIAGFYSSRHSYTQEKERWRAVLEDMNRAQKRRGPDEEGISLTDHCGLAHVRLSIIDLNKGRQPMTRTDLYRFFQWGDLQHASAAERAGAGGRGV